MFQLCGNAGGIPGAVVIKVDSTKTGNKPTVIGTYNSTQAIEGSKYVEEEKNDHNFPILLTDLVLIIC